MKSNLLLPAFVMLVVGCAGTAPRSPAPPRPDGPTSLVIDKGSVKVGDRIGRFTVKSVDRRGGSLVDVTLRGEVEVSGAYSYTDSTGDGTGWVFEVDEASAKALPVLADEKPEQARVFVLSNPEVARSLLGKGEGKARLVLGDLSLGERQIVRRARIVWRISSVAVRSKVSQCNALNWVINQGSDRLKQSMGAADEADPRAFRRIADQIKDQAAQVRAVRLEDAKLVALQSSYQAILLQFAQVFLDMADAMTAKDSAGLAEIRKRLGAVVTAEDRIIAEINGYCEAKDGAPR